MERYTTFEVDIALIGGQSKDTFRRLPWSHFLSHWKAILPAQEKAFWDFSKDTLRWETVSVIPPEWSTYLWPDFLHHGTAEEKSTLLHMALADGTAGMDYDPHALATFEWLVKSGVSSNVWPGHGSSVVASVCLRGKPDQLRTLLSAGQDIQCTVHSGARPEFLGSSLLFRVGTAVAKQAMQVDKKGSNRKNPFASVLKLLAKYSPDPWAPNAQGVSPLAGIEGEHPQLANEVKAILAQRKEWDLAASLGMEGASDRYQALLESQRGWVEEAKAADGHPLWIVPEAVDPFGDARWPRAFRVVPAHQPGALVVRSQAPARADGPLDRERAFEAGRAQKADAIIELTDEGQRWWVFHPQQIRRAIGPAVELKSAPRLRF